MQKTFVLWLTGLSASGKTTLAREIFKNFQNKNLKVHHLDGDEVRERRKENFGFDEVGRDANIKSAIELARDYQNQGFVVVAGFISPYCRHRQWARESLDNFIEVFMDTPLQVCEARDPKGLYKKARLGEIANFTGIGDRYEKPKNPDILISDFDSSVESKYFLVEEYLQIKRFLNR